MFTSIVNECMKKRTIKFFVLLIVCFLTQYGAAQQKRTLNFSRPTIIAVSYDEEPLWHEKIYEDGNYLFVIRDYGKAEYEPNFFVYGKKQRKWMEVKKLSTEHAKLGRSASPKAKSALQDGWDYSGLKTVNYVNLPLRASGSINFPDKITYDDKNKIFIFNFNSSAGVEEILTRFWVLKKDLDEALRQ